MLRRVPRVNRGLLCLADPQRRPCPNFSFGNSPKTDAGQVLGVQCLLVALGLLKTPSCSRSGVSLSFALLPSSWIFIFQTYLHPPRFSGFFGKPSPRTKESVHECSVAENSCWVILRGAGLCLSLLPRRSAGPLGCCSPRLLQEAGTAGCARPSTEGLRLLFGLCLEDDFICPPKLQEEAGSGSPLCPHIGANPPLALPPCLSFPFGVSVLLQRGISMN